MKIKLLAVGMVKKRPISELAEEYAGRIQRLHSFEVQEIPDEAVRANSDVAKVLTKEGAALSKAMKKGACPIILDEKGTQWSSTDLAWELGRMFQEPFSEIVFVIGGAYGLAPQLKEQAKHLLSLSKLTLTHDLARVLCLEQIYRALTILRNVPYHHE
jgi:23S rRNA (pseudouridine1915-N3)-methyltransferase